jgi:hypothetical protein
MDCRACLERFNLAVENFVQGEERSIDCLMLWSGWIAILSPVEIPLWYTATTLNLVSLSVVSLYNEILKM